jgi:hypothetical protein
VANVKLPIGARQATKPDMAGPTPERLAMAGEFYTISGATRSTRRFNMADDALGKAYKRGYVSGQEHAALEKYALHWLAGGLAGHLGSVDLNRVLAHDPNMAGQAQGERQAMHRDLYHTARGRLGTRPAFVADHIACFDTPMADVAIMLGYRSPFRGRDKVRQILSDAGYRLVRIWQELR